MASSNRNSKADILSFFSSVSRNPDPDQYTNLCLESIISAYHFIFQERKDITAELLFYYLGSERQNIAKIFKDRKYKKFGVKRLKESATPITDNADDNQYQRYHDYLHRKLMSIPETDESLPLRYNWTHTFGLSKHLTIYDGELALSNIAIILDTPGNDFLRKMLRDIGNKKDDMHIYHTPVKNIDKVFNRIEPLFQQILNSEADIETLKNIGRITWYLGHVMPLERGSASTLEMFVATLMLTSGFHLVPSQNKVTLDLEAMFEPDKERYAQNFVDWFPDCYSAKNLSPR